MNRNQTFMAPQEISERIFACLDAFNFKMTAQVIADWELDQAQKTVEELRAFTTNTLIQAYWSMVKNPASTEVFYVDDRLVMTCFRSLTGELQFQIDFVLVQGYSEKFK